MAVMTPMFWNVPDFNVLSSDVIAIAGFVAATGALITLWVKFSRRFREWRHDVQKVKFNIIGRPEHTHPVTGVMVPKIPGIGRRLYDIETAQNTAAELLLSEDAARVPILKTVQESLDSLTKMVNIIRSEHRDDNRAVTRARLGLYRNDVALQHEIQGQQDILLKMLQHCRNCGGSNYPPQELDAAEAAFKRPVTLRWIPEEPAEEEHE